MNDSKTMATRKTHRICFGDHGCEICDRASVYIRYIERERARSEIESQR